MRWGCPAQELIETGRLPAPGWLRPCPINPKKIETNGFRVRVMSNPHQGSTMPTAPRCLKQLFLEALSVLPAESAAWLANMSVPTTLP